jgi:hypothetical protein
LLLDYQGDPVAVPTRLSLDEFPDGLVEILRLQVDPTS